jgi:hypothetical protein
MVLRVLRVGLRSLICRTSRGAGLSELLRGFCAGESGLQVMFFRD